MNGSNEKQTLALERCKRAILALEAFLQRLDTAYETAKAAADKETVEVKWSSGGKNMTPLGSCEPFLMMDVFVGNYKRAKLQRAYPQRAKLVYEYHLNQEGQLTGVRLHSRDDEAWQERFGPYYHEVFCVARAEGREAYASYSQRENKEKELRWLYFYTDYADRQPMTYVAFDVLSGGYEVQICSRDAESGTLSNADIHLTPDSSMAKMLALLPDFEKIATRMQQIKIGDTNYRMVYREWTVLKT